MNCSQSARATIAGLLWVAIGIMLLVRGFFPYFGITKDASGLNWALICIALGVVIGAAKGVFVLSKSSRRVIKRIEDRPGKAPFWSMYPIVLVILIPVMIGMGLALRHFYGASHPGLILGVYAGIGAALLASSLPFFAAAKRF